MVLRTGDTIRYEKTRFRPATRMIKRRLGYLFAVFSFFCVFVQLPTIKIAEMLFYND